MSSNPHPETPREAGDWRLDAIKRHVPPALIAKIREDALAECHGYIVSQAIRVEYLGGQQTSYVQRATILDWLELEILKLAAPSSVSTSPEENTDE